MDMVSYLVEKGAKVNAPPAPLEGFTALQLAASGGSTAIAELKIEQGADVNAPTARTTHDRTTSEAATEFGRLDMMLHLEQSELILT